MLPYMQRSNSPTFGHFKSVLHSVPTPISHFFSQSGSLFWDFMGETGIKTTAWWDHQIFAGGIATVALLVFAIITIHKIRTDKQQRKTIPAMLLITMLITFFLYMRIGKVSAYIFVYFLPGFSAMRSITRIINIELIFFGIALAYLTAKILHKEGIVSFLIFVALTGAVIADNYFKEGKPYRNLKQEALKRTEPLIRMMSQFPKNAVVSYEPATQDLPAFFYQIDAMMAAQHCNLKTVNGYTGTSPVEYNRYWHEMNEESRNQWLTSREITFDTLYVIHSETHYAAVSANDLQNPKVKEDEIKEIIEYIRSDSAWMKLIEEKALKNNIATDSMLKLDAEWVRSERKKEKH
jgi:hypothetical protein